MARLARKGLQNQTVRNKAVELTTAGFLNGQGLQQKDFAGEARRCLAFVRDDIRYVMDTDGVELLHDPEYLLQIGAGDCDDKAILLAALLGSIGHTTRFIAVAFEPGVYCHVWVQDYLAGQWVNMEPTEPIPFGSTVPLGNAVDFLTQAVSDNPVAANDPGIPAQSMDGIFSTILNVVGAVTIGDPGLGNQLTLDAVPGYAPITQTPQQIADTVTPQVLSALKSGMVPNVTGIAPAYVQIAGTIAPSVAIELANQGYVFPDGTVGAQYQHPTIFDAFGGQNAGFVKLASIGLAGLLLLKVL